MSKITQSIVEIGAFAFNRFAVKIDGKLYGIYYRPSGGEAPDQVVQAMQEMDAAAYAIMKRIFKEPKQQFLDDATEELSRICSADRNLVQGILKKHMEKMK